MSAAAATALFAVLKKPPVALNQTHAVAESNEDELAVYYFVRRPARRLGIVDRNLAALVRVDKRNFHRTRIFVPAI